MRGDFAERNEDHEALGQSLGEWVYPLRNALGVGEGRHLFHQDLPLLTDVALELDRRRARCRLCLEEDISNRRWLLARVDTVTDEQARRAERAWAPTDPEEIPERRTREPEDPTPPAARQRRAERPSRRPDREGHGLRGETLREAVRRRLAESERQEADTVVDGVVEREDAR